MNGTILSSGDAVRTLTVNRPERRNAMNDDVFVGLLEGIRAANADPAVAVIVVRGAGPAFSAGADLTPSGEPRGEEFWTRKFDLEMRLMRTILESPKPTIAVVHGHCLGIAFDVALACDFTIARKDTRLGLPEALFGQGQLLFILPWIVSKKVASELLVCGTLVTAEKAQQLGIVNSVVPEEELEAELARFCTALRAIPPGGAAGNKSQLLAAYAMAGMDQALNAARLRAITALTELSIEPAEGEEARKGGTFDEIRARDGLKAAIRWQRGVRLVRDPSGATFNDA